MIAIVGFFGLEAMAGGMVNEAVLNARQAAFKTSTATNRAIEETEAAAGTQTAATEALGKLNEQLERIAAQSAQIDTELAGLKETLSAWEARGDAQLNSVAQRYADLERQHTELLASLQQADRTVATLDPRPGTPEQGAVACAEAPMDQIVDPDGPGFGCGTPMDVLELEELAHEFDLDADLVMTVAQVASSGNTLIELNEKRRPVILFEPHVFYRALPADLRPRAARENLARPRWGDLPYAKTQEERYGQLLRAYQIDPGAAVSAVSWGWARCLVRTQNG